MGTIGEFVVRRLHNYRLARRFGTFAKVTSALLVLRWLAAQFLQRALLIVVGRHVEFSLAGLVTTVFLLFLCLPMAAVGNRSALARGQCRLRFALG